ncbi:hypothetical protein [Mesomycoplasma lagogenitalium]|uniref:ATP synthase epsilon chain n=1 Tax=Mesomycoplasma lagogenitalium TaxID=171286 RepID=A0ABY8LUZ9_9BACT|nr:hypothetical protein [Mesomycoplasma lagogenitalium]WGI37049.1 hypothetical protein QEG99_02080 [Mesomycoplasma lagogenitalium]
MKKTKVKIITPNGTFLEQETEIVTLKTTEGYKGIQYGTQPFVSSIVPSKMFVGWNTSNEQKIIYINSGIVYAESAFINIITDSVSYSPFTDSSQSFDIYNDKLKNSNHIQNIQKEISIKKELEKNKK